MNPAGESIPDVFRRMAKQHAARIALATPAEDWTYAELHERSDAVARLVLERKPDAARPIAVLMEHDAPLIATILGVLKAGRMYLSLDPQNPPARWSAVVQEAQPTFLLCDAANQEKTDPLAKDGVGVLTISGSAISAVGSVSWPVVAPESPAWLMFTSGSTGAPKGVWQSHASVIHHARVYAELIELSLDDRLSLLTSTSLAASATHLFAALLHGATLAPFALRTQGVEKAAGWLRAQRISVYHSAPTVFRHLAQAPGGARNLETLRLIRLGGEPLLRSDAELFQRLGPESCRLLHALSSTETGLVCALFLDKHTPLTGARVPVGRPVGGVEVRLLDDHGNPVSPGREGRIAVCSEHLQHGYWRQPALDAEKFRSDPGNPRRRIFLSNDLGRWLPDGSLEHLGRTDAQVKLRGWRVDLAEVEAAVNATGLVAESAAAVCEGRSGERWLVAYFVPRAGPPVDASALRRALAHLPEHLIPTGFVPLEHLPQTAGGKIDRRALPRWSPQTGAGREFLEPRKGVESNLAEIWESVLGVKPVGRQDDFFNLGGSSLQSVQVLRHVQERFDLVLSPSTLVEHSTIESLSALVAARALRPATGPLVVLRAANAGRPFFLVHGAEGDLALYGQLVRRLPERPIYGFQCPGLDGECDPVLGIPKLAEIYLARLVERDPTGPYLLGGTRMGAWVAFEMAHQLARQGKPASLVAMFDFYLPRPRRVVDPLVFGLTKLRDRLRVKFWALWRARRQEQKSNWLTNYREFVAKMNCHSRHEYQLQFYPGTITLFVTADRLTDGERLAQCARETRVIQIPGRKEGLLAAPAVDVVARELAGCLCAAE